MRQNKALIIEFVTGIILIGAGVGIRIDYYSTLIFAMGVGLAVGSVRQMFHIWYWNRPGRRDEYEIKKREAYINSVDERRRFLQMKAGQISAQIMLGVLLVLDFALALFRAEPWVTGMVFVLFLLFWGSDVAVFRYLEKKM